jgi:glyoxylase-like metal-dependent hydrolase (beta-lactamase superfamily II)
MSEPRYEIYAIRYGTNAHRRRTENFIWTAPDDVHDAPMPMDFFVWAVVGPDRTVLVDTGSAPATMTPRGHTHLRAPVAGLRAIGIEPHAVTDVIATHLHWDHAGNLADVPDARLHVQQLELAHATGPAMARKFLRRPYDAEQVNEWLRALFGGRVAFHRGDEELAPGVSIHHVGGHTPGMQVVRVRTDRGHVVLASDAVHYYDNLREENPFPVLVSTIDYVEALTTVRALADSDDHIVPGHDPSVLSGYPPHPRVEGVVGLHLAPRTAPI